MAVSSSLDMTTGPFLKKIFAFAIPVMITGLLQILYNAADVVVVGNFSGSKALAAVSSNGSLINLIVGLFVGFATGAGVVAANYIGAGDRKAIANTAHTSMAFSLICGFIVLTIGEVFAETFLRLMNVPEDILALSTLYLRIYFIGSPASLVYNFGAAILRANGDSQRPLIILGISGLVNVILNLILVIFFNMSVDGVAIATITAQYLSAIWVVLILSKRTDASRLVFKKIKFHTEEFLQIIRVGFPAGIQSICFSLSNVVLQSGINSFGSIAVAGCGIGANIDNMIWICLNAFTQAAMTFSSQNMGAKKYLNINKVYYTCLGCTVVTGIVLGAIIVIFAQAITGFFTDDPEVLKIAVDRIYFLIPIYFICGIMDVAAGQLRGIGKSFAAMVVTIIGVCGLRLLWMWFIFPLNPTLMNIFATYPVTWIITLISLYVIYLKTYNNLKKKELTI